MLEIDIPEVLAELTAAFDAYERALTGNDIETVNRLFWASPLTVRYGTREGERHYGHTAIAEFRIRRGAVHQVRTLENTRITTFGRHFGIASTEFRNAGSDKIGRQSQTWIRTDDGWRIAGAHVSFGL
jgi:1-carboxybiuret hydrolase subunit AtzH-like protein